MNADTLSIVLPAFNECEHLAEAINCIAGRVAELGVPYEIIAVDDGSSDRTWEVICGLTEGNKHIHGISLSRNFGKEAAVLAGLEASQGQVVVVMDCDLQHPPELIAEMYRLWREEGYDVVNAQKEARQREGLFHAVAARAFYGLFDRLTGGSLRNSSDFKLLDRRVVNVYCNLPERNRFFRGLVSWLGYRQTSLPFSVAERVGGESKWPAVGLMRLGVNAIVSFSPLPLHFVTMIGGMFLLLAIVLAVHTAVVTFMGNAEAGFPTVILLILLVGSVLMISQGILGEYQAKIYDEVKSRPPYLVRQRIESATLKPLDEGTETSVENRRLAN